MSSLKQLKRYELEIYTAPNAEGDFCGLEEHPDGDYFLASDAEALLAKAQEAETVLDAWKAVFGTQQLTHAKDRLDHAEREMTRLQALLASREGAVDRVKQLVIKLRDAAFDSDHASAFHLMACDVLSALADFSTPSSAVPKGRKCLNPEWLNVFEAVSPANKIAAEEIRACYAEIDGLMGRLTEERSWQSTASSGEALREAAERLAEAAIAWQSNNFAMFPPQAGMARFVGTLTDYKVAAEVKP